MVAWCSLSIAQFLLKSGYIMPCLNIKPLFRQHWHPKTEEELNQLVVPQASLGLPQLSSFILIIYISKPTIALGVPVMAEETPNCFA